MNLKILAAFLFLLFFGLGSGAVQACPDGDPSDLGYIRRDNNRCEGVNERVPINNSLRLISLATRGTNALGDMLTIRVPRTRETSTPNVKLVAVDDSYQLDRISLIHESSFYIFEWPTYVLREAGISVNQLRATAIISDEIYLPVIIGQRASRYEFVFYTSRYVRFPSVEIRCNNRTVLSTSRLAWNTGEIIFSWDGRTEPSGRCQLDYQAEIEEWDREPRSIPPDTIEFEHDPNWLR